ncbi:hypothetical protein [Flavobacterium sp. XS2P39]|uniref:hypothetical protein n=1 Tax=Flavobacterium sp. XS2P39 TaxID=3401725 RepID=UPI003AACB75B
METNGIKKIQELQEMVNTHFTKLKPNEKEKNTCTVSFTVYDYSHLMFIISDLMKLCIYATEDEFGLDSCSVVSSKINIAQILEIAIELLPIDEAEFLDQSRKLFFKKNGNDIPEN